MAIRRLRRHARNNGFRPVPNPRIRGQVPAPKELPRTMQILVTTSKTFTVELLESSTMRDLKEKIEDVEGTPAEHQFLVCLSRNKLLQAADGDQLTKLADMGVHNGSTLQMVVYTGPRE
ncbi:uncharacterized protein [Physcomitrium patens]|uniref:Ubiquitin-like domain-containing protein n=1 Tax=Physcomitrium patens TaxID=3218 RepID=A0A2K1J8U2_PHYPA|nr:polyubiquitin-like [Physcomitrium patens]PNR37944.1 hypothetical protein PHYPA_021054 [Physcomitrium patens]|eukprot:XP_024398423.1 polyubiquitin-like [Physcomitrella patens]